MRRAALQRLVEGPGPELSSLAALCREPEIHHLHGLYAGDLASQPSSQAIPARARQVRGVVQIVLRIYEHSSVWYVQDEQHAQRSSCEEFRIERGSKPRGIPTLQLTLPCGDGEHWSDTSVQVPSNLTSSIPASEVVAVVAAEARSAVDEQLAYSK